MGFEVFNPPQQFHSEYLVGKAAEALNVALKKEQGNRILLLLSGGSSIPLLNNVNPQYLNENITVSVLDERYSKNPDENNMAQISKTEFFSKAKNSGCAFIDTHVGANESQEELAERFNSALKNWFQTNPKGKVIATVGIGPDGHLSGIMPFPENPSFFNSRFVNTDNFVVGYDAGSKNTFSKRVTTTMPLLRRINTSICYVVGESKKDAVKRLLAADGTLHETPARILRESEGNVLLFTDCLSDDK